MRDKPVGGKGKTVPSRYSKARSDAGAAKKFNDYYGASDVKNPSQRAATAQQRQQALTRGAKKVIASKMAGYGPSAPSASPTSKKKTSNAAQATEAKRAAAARRRAAAKRSLPNTK